MSVKKNVLIYGRSLCLAGITACLEHDEGLSVKFIDSHDSQAKQSLDELKPEVILFDLTDPPDDLDLTVLPQLRGILLIGVDPSNDEVFVLQSQRSRVVSSGELSLLISAQTDPEDKNGL